MDFTVTDIYGQEKGPLEHCGAEFIVGTEDNDFEIKIQENLFKDDRHRKNCRVFAEETEYGGLIRALNPVTEDKVIKLKGSTWRGILNQRALNPKSNSHVVLRGEANTVLKEYLTKLGLTEIFGASSENSGIDLNYQAPLQSMLLDAFVSALETQNARLEIKYKLGDANDKGYVELSAKPIVDHSEQIEISKDGNVKLNILDYQNGVLDEGKKAEAQILTNNSVRVFDATFVIQGRRDVMAANAYADVTIANGEQGMYRNDIIVRKYEKDEMTEIENTSFDVIKGTPSSGVATDPEIPTGDIRTGATMHNMALYRVKLEGLNIVALEPMFKVLYNMADIKKELESLNGKTDLKIIEKHIDTGYLKSGVHFYKRNSFGQIHFSSLQGWSLPYATTKLCDFPDGYRPALRKKGVLYFGAEAVGFVEIRTEGLFATPIKELNSSTSYLNCDINYWIE